MYTVQMSLWVAGEGYRYTTEIDRIDGKQAAEEYIKGCLSNLRGDDDEPYPWEPIGEDEDAEITVIDEDGNPIGEPCWVSDCE